MARTAAVAPTLARHGIALRDVLHDHRRLVAVRKQAKPLPQGTAKLHETLDTLHAIVQPDTEAA